VIAERGYNLDRTTSIAPIWVPASPSEKSTAVAASQDPTKLLDTHESWIGMRGGIRGLVSETEETAKRVRTLFNCAFLARGLFALGHKP